MLQTINTLTSLPSLVYLECVMNPKQAQKACSPSSSVTAEQVILAEHALLNKSENLTGLTLSGGGIRSAAFALGVMQSLVAAGLLKKCDYLSTSSGGGYIGSSLTYFLHHGLPNGGSEAQQKAGLDTHNFPLGITQDSTHNPALQISSNNVLNFLRQHSHYLTPTHSLNALSLIGLVLRTGLVSLLVHFAFFLTFFIALAVSGILPAPFIPTLSSLLPANLFLVAAKTLIGLFVFGSIVYAILTAVSSRLKGAPYSWRIHAQIAMGLLLQAVLVCLFLGTLPHLHALLTKYAFIQHQPLSTAGISTFLGTVLGAFKKTSGSGNSFFAKIRPILISALITYGLVFGAYSSLQALQSPQQTVLLIAITAALLLAAYFINTNYFSLHRMYRDRLMENFMPNASSVKNNQWQRATDADKTQLQDMCNPAIQVRPYHLINTNVVLSDSTTARFHGRGGDSFTLSPLYCGSSATGFIATNNWNINGSKGISLPTAMAISGAALNPNAGNNSKGATRNFWVAGILTVLNLRLGHWVSNPSRQSAALKQPNFYTTGLFNKWLGVNHSETSQMLELTDGGHFDNLGLYELIRRKVKLIIISDAGADAQYHFDDLGASVERVRVDFGVKIRFEHSLYTLDNLQPGTAPANAALTEKYHLARNSFALANIHYPDGSHGHLIYIKATLIERLPADLYTFKSSNPAFPHDPTADQFFDETQFESYRELGYQLTWSMLNAFGFYQDKQWVANENSPLSLLL